VDKTSKAEKDKYRAKSLETLVVIEYSRTLGTVK
jgi:hypothetical protein